MSRPSATDRGRRTALIGLVLISAAGCRASDVSSAPPDATATASATAASTATPSATPADAAPASSPSAVPSATATRVVETIATEGIVKTVVDDLRARSEPRVSDDSFKFEPLIPRGTRFLVTDGPVAASGYRWLRVAALTTDAPELGWVADASRSGEPWLRDGTFACPPVPTDLATLAALPSGTGLACFAREPITVEARLIPCNCDIDGSWYSPDWFYLGGGSPDLLVEPTVAQPPDDTTDWFPLHLDPAGNAPYPLPVGDRVEVTGIFDHPAAANCTLTPMDGQPAPSNDCRLEFAVTDLVRIGP